MSAPLTVEAADKRVGASRDRLDTLVAELDRRRHVVSRARNALREHPGAELAIGLLALCVAGGAVALAVRAGRQGRIAKHTGPGTNPPAAALARPEPTLGRKLLTSALTSLISVLVKRWAQKLLARAAHHPNDGALLQDDGKLQLGKA